MLICWWDDGYEERFVVFFELFFLLDSKDGEYRDFVVIVYLEIDLGLIFKDYVVRITFGSLVVFVF